MLSCCMTGTTTFFMEWTKFLPMVNSHVIPCLRAPISQKTVKIQQHVSAFGLVGRLELRPCLWLLQRLLNKCICRANVDSKRIKHKAFCFWSILAVIPFNHNKFVSIPFDSTFLVCMMKCIVKIMGAVYLSSQGLLRFTGTCLPYKNYYNWRKNHDHR